MRVNVYAEELTDRVELVTKTADTGITFYGVRIYLESPDSLHQGSQDDDTSAVTLWVPWSKANGNEVQLPREIFLKALEWLDHVPTATTPS